MPTPNSPNSQPDPVDEFSLRAFDSIEKSNSYSEGLESILGDYEKLPEDVRGAARAALQERVEDLTYYHKEPYFDPKTTIEYALEPINYDVEDSKEDKIKKISEWEDKNTALLDAAEDPTYNAIAPKLKRSIEALASTARQDLHGNTGDSIGHLIWDNTLRAAQGAVGLPAEALGYPEVGKAIQERTDPTRDGNLVPDIMGGIGQLGGIAASGAIGAGIGSLAGPGGAVAGGNIGVGAAMGAQTVGAARSQYSRMVEQTGNEGRALQSAAIEGGSQLIESTAIGHAVGSAAASIASKVSRGAAKSLLIPAAENAAGESLSQVGSNIAQGVGLNEDINYFEGTGRAAIVGAVVGPIPGAASEAYIQLKQYQEAREMYKISQAIDDAAKEQTANIKESVTSIPPEEIVDVKPAETAETAETSKDTYSLDKAATNLFGEQEAPHPESFYSAQTESLYNQYEIHEKIKNPQEDLVGLEPEDTANIAQETEQDFSKSVLDDATTFFDKVVPTAEDTITAKDSINPAEATSQGTNIPEDVRVYSPEYDAQIEDMTPAPLANLILKAVGTSVTAKEKLAGYFGSYTLNSKGEKGIDILKSLGSDPKKLLKVAMHEVSHALDALNASNTKEWMSRAEAPILQRLATLNTFIKNKFEGLDIRDERLKEKIDQVLEEAKQVSKVWRPGWTDPNDTYRNDSKELFADVASAFILDPTFVRKTAPNIYNAIESGIAKDPRLKDAFQLIMDFKHNPKKVQEIINELKKTDRMRQGQIKKAKRLADQKAEPSLYKKTADALKSARQSMFDHTAPAHEIVKRLSGKTRAEAEAILNDVQLASFGFVKYSFDHIVESRMLELIESNKRAGIDHNTFNESLWVKHFEKDTSFQIEDIRTNPNLYFKLAEWLTTTKVTYPNSTRTVSTDYEGKLAKALATGDVETLIEGFAQSAIARNSDVPFTLEEMRKIYPDTAEGQQRAADAYTRKVHEFNMQNKVPAVSEILAQFDAEIRLNPKSPLKSYRGNLEALMAEDSFNVRRFVISSGFDNIVSVRQRLDSLTENYTPEQKKILAENNVKFHDILSDLLPTFEAAGIFDPNLLGRIKLNKDSYVYTAVLKYLEIDPSIKATIKSRAGTLEAVGDEAASTVAKLRAIYFRARQQIAQNGLVDLAEAHAGAVPYTLEPNTNPFDFVNIENRRQTTKEGYLIKSVDGKYQVYQVPDKSWTRILNGSRLIEAVPWINAFGNLIETFNKVTLFKPLVTSYSPVFVLRQKFIDYNLETAKAGSFIYNRDVRRFNKEARNFVNAIASKTDRQELLKRFPSYFESLYKFNIATEQVGQSLNEDKVTSEDAFYELLDPNYNSDNIKPIPDKIEKKLLSVLNKVGGNLIATQAAKDELVTKLVGYQIGLMQGKSKPEAARWARNTFGTPDPYGGGTEAAIINKYLSFGRVYLNGLRNVAKMFEEAKGVKGNAVFFFHVVAPRILSSPLIMPIIIGALYGEEAKKIYQEMLDRIPTYERLSGVVIPVGFLDDKGAYVDPLSVNFKDINIRWKTLFNRMPQTREHTAIAASLWPAFEEMLQGEFTKGAEKFGSGSVRALSASVQPLVEIAFNAAALLQGKNPEDYFREKTIIPPDVFKSGNLFDKWYAWSKYRLEQRLPGGGSDLFKLSSLEDPEGAIETALTSYPVFSNLLRAGVRASNYGLWEKQKDASEEKEQFNAEVRSMLPESVILAYREAGKVASFDVLQSAVSGKKKGKQRDVLPKEERARYARIATWKNKVYTPIMNDMKRFYEMGDEATVEKLAGRLERMTKRYRIFPANSSVARKLAEDKD